VLRQKRIVHIETAVWRQVENRLGENTAVGDNDNNLGMPANYSFEKVGIANLLWSDHRYASPFSHVSHWRWNTPLPPACRTIRLGNDSDHGIRSLDQLLQCGRCNLRGSHEHNGPGGRHKK